MKIKEKTALILICIGLAIMAIAASDAISVAADILELLIGGDFNSPFLASFAFRVFVLMIGALFLLVGGLLYRNKEES